MQRLIKLAAMAAFIVGGITACGGGGGGDGSTASNGAPSTGAASPGTSAPIPGSIFVTLSAINSIAVFSNPNPQPGTNLTGQLITGFSGPIGDAISYDAANDRLYAGAGKAIVAFDHASAASGAVPPTRTITPAGVATLSISGVFLDKAADTLYVLVGRQYDGALVVIGHAGTANGTVTPDHVYPLGEGAGAFAIDSRRRLMYLQSAISGVSVYDLATLKDAGPNMPVRRLSATVLATGLSIDVARDRLYAADPFNGVAIMDSASTATGGVPYKSVRTSPLTPFYVTVDSGNDRLYVGMYNGAAEIINGASTLTNGSVPPAAVAVGNAGAGVTVTGFAFP